MGLNLIMATAMSGVLAGGCSWAHPGANPYRGDPPAALADFTMPEETRRQLRALMAAHRYTDIVTITRDGIVGQGQYGDLREMHSGRGQVCHGSVDRSAWSAKHEERGLVYCVGETCVIVPTVCNNVSLVTRKPDEASVLDGADEPIDISPAAGPPATQDAVVAQGPDSGPLDFIVPDAPLVAPDSPAGGGIVGTPGFPIDGGGGGGGDGIPTSPGGGSPCCGTGGPTGPVGPGAPPVIPPTSPVPEAPSWALLLAGLAGVGARGRWRG